MSIETLRRLIDKYGAHCTLSDVMAHECAERIRTKLGLPLDASEAEVHAAVRQKIKRLVDDEHPATQEANTP